MARSMIKRTAKISMLAVLLLCASLELLRAAEAPAEWQRLTGAAKKEGKIVIGAPPGNDFATNCRGR